jgi:hypothetical protein
VLSRRQVIECGIQGEAIKYRLRSGEWQRIHQGVYRIRGAPVSWD